jgi:hypothetical protein
MKGCSRFSSFIFWISPILDKCMPRWWVEPWILQQHQFFFKKSLVEGCEEYDLLGGGTWTTQKEQLADAGPTAPICNHTDMGLWQRTVSTRLYLSARFSQKEKLKVESKKLKGFWRFSIKKISENDQTSIFSFQLVFQLSISPQYVSLQNYFSHTSLVIYYFAASPIKLKLGEQIGGELFIANHLDQSLRRGN